MINQQAMHSLNCHGRLLGLDRPVIMGILNATPDSFFDGGKFIQETEASARVEQMLSEGAGIIDIGGVSTRPGAEGIETETEWKRVAGILKSVRKNFQQAFISLDTSSAEIARRGIAEGADIINDVSGGEEDPAMFPLIAEGKTPYVLMHTKGKPATMQENPEYENVVREVLTVLVTKARKLRDMGAGDIVLDPGFGFGKDIRHNYTLLSSLELFAASGFPVLAGFSRKSMINRVIGTKPEEALNGTTALNTIALMKGVSILRVHDVKEAAEVVKIYLEMRKAT